MSPRLAYCVGLVAGGALRPSAGCRHEPSRLGQGLPDWAKASGKIAFDASECARCSLWSAVRPVEAQGRESEATPWAMRGVTDGSR